MADTKISQLPQQSTPSISGKVPVVENGVTDYETLQDIISLVFQNYPAADPSITGWQANRNNAAFPTPNTITANGNRSYDLVFNSVDLSGIISNGMRLRLTRTAPAPTQCSSLNGTTQYFSKAAPAGMTFTDDFSAGAWIKMTAYNTSANQVIASRYNGTSGWEFAINAYGQVQLYGFNASASNNSGVSSYQSIPLNRWVHVAAQLDMSAFTPTTLTSYVMINGVDVPTSVSRGGTNPTALVQAGSLEIGSENAGTKNFTGKMAQVAIYSAKVTQATWLASISQTIAGTETSLISGYSFSNSVTDLNTTNANNLTANAGASSTNADSPYSQQADGTIGTKDYAIVMKVSYSTNTTITVHAPEGNTIPTSGGISAVAYSAVKNPYGFPGQTSKWRITSIIRAPALLQATPTAGVWYNIASFQLNVPVGEWKLGYKTIVGMDRSVAGRTDVAATLSTANNSNADTRFTSSLGSGNANSFGAGETTGREDISLTAATIYYHNVNATLSVSAGNLYLFGIIDTPSAEPTIYAENAYL